MIVSRKVSVLKSLLSLVIAAACVYFPVPVFAQSASKGCDLALILALDASSSVDPREYELQQKGLAAALLDREVQESISALGGMYLTAFEWSGRYHQELMVDWRYLQSSDQISDFAFALANHKRVYSEFPTAIGYALGFSAKKFSEVPVPCQRKVVDVSGDGVNNEGFSPQLAYSNFDFVNVTVNGLVIKGARPDPESFYRNEVLYGAGAFLEISDGFEDYERAMKKKLLKEIGNRNLSQLIKSDIKPH